MKLEDLLVYSQEPQLAIIMSHINSVHTLSSFLWIIHFNIY